MSEDGQTVLYKKGYQCDVAEVWANGMIRKGFATAGKVENKEAEAEVIIEKPKRAAKRKPLKFD